MFQKLILLITALLLISCATKDEAFYVEVYSHNTNLTGQDLKLSICSASQKISLYADGEESVSEKIVDSELRISSTNQKQRNRLPGDNGRVWWKVGMLETPHEKPSVPTEPRKRSFQLAAESFQDYLLCSDVTNNEAYILPITGVCPSGTTAQIEAADCE